MTQVDQPPVAAADPAAGRRQRSVGIDVIKGLAILAVVGQHTLPGELKHEIGAPLWLSQAVPIFVLLIGFNSAGSFARNPGRRLGELYTRDYVVSRFKRLIVPILPVYAVMFGVAILQGRLNLGGLQLIGAAPLDTGAPGDYFIATAVSIAVLFPFVWWAYRANPRMTLVGLVVINLVMELIARPLLDDGSALRSYIAGANPFRVAATIAVGMWLAGQADWIAAVRRHAWAVAIAVAFSFAFLVALWLQPPDEYLDGFGVLYPGFTVATGIWALGWTFALTVVVVIAVDRMPRHGLITEIFAELGRASWHIFLVQAAIIGLWRTTNPYFIAAEGVAALWLGWMYWKYFRV